MRVFTVHTVHVAFNGLVLENLQIFHCDLRSGFIRTFFSESGYVYTTSDSNELNMIYAGLVLRLHEDDTKYDMNQYPP